MNIYAFVLIMFLSSCFESVKLKGKQMTTGEKAEHYFNLGRGGFRGNKDVKKTCDNIDFSLSFFCEEGYYFQGYATKLNDPPSTASMGLGEGIALAHFRKKFVFSKNLNRRINAYIADGLGFGRSYQSKGNLKADLDLCQDKELGEFLKYCFFGVGRALFFKQMELKEKDLPPELISGWTHAAAFAGDLYSSDNKYSSLAQTIKNNNLSPIMLKCLKANHVIDCIGYKREGF